MKTRSAPFALFALLTLLAGCSDDSGTDPPPDDSVTVDDLVGSWSATAHTFTNQADTDQTIDLIANGGETRNTILDGGGVRFWLEFGTFSDEFDALLTISGESITITPVEASRRVRMGTFTLVGSVFTTTNTDGLFDFTLSGGPEVPATEVIVWERR